MVTIHQPHFLPWLGYWNKVMSADVFVWLDTVDFRKNYYQNRVYVKGTTGKPLWLTVPVSAKQGQVICDVAVVGDHWRRKLPKTIAQCYSHAPCFRELAPAILEVLGKPRHLLAELNLELFEVIREMLGVTTSVVVASEMAQTSDDPTQRLVDLCKQLDGTHYIAGKGGKNYMDVARFQESGIQVVFQDFHSNMPVYPQLHGEFVHGLSVIDPLFNVGPQATVELIRGSWSPRL